MTAVPGASVVIRPEALTVATRRVGRSIDCRASDVSGSAIRVDCSPLNLGGCSCGKVARGRSQGDRGRSSGCDRYARRRTLPLIGGCG